MFPCLCVHFFTPSLLSCLFKNKDVINSTFVIRFYSSTTRSFLNFRQLDLKKRQFFPLLENIFFARVYFPVNDLELFRFFLFDTRGDVLFSFTCMSFVLSWAKSVGIGKMLNLVLPVCQNFGLSYLCHCYSS